MIKKLQNIPLFHNLDEGVLEKLSSIITECKFDEKEEIFKEGEIGDALFIIEEGEIEIRKLISEEEGRFKTLAKLFRGEYFGEMALFDEKPRSASAHCIIKSNIFKIRGSDFQRQLQEDTKTASVLLSAIIFTMSGRLRQTSRELVTLYETGKIVGERQNITTSSKKILKQILFAIPEADAGLFAIFNEFTDEYEVTSCEGYHLTEDNKIIDKNESLVFDAVSKQETILLSNIDDYKKIKDIKDRFYFGPSLLLSPMMVQDNVLGMVILTNKTKKNAFTSDNANLLSAVTSQVASAIQNAKHLKEEDDRKRLERKFIR